MVYAWIAAQTGGSGGGEGAGAAALLAMLCGGLIGLAFHFIPTIVAVIRKHRNTGPIVLVNLLLGWSCIGWVVALAWSMTDQTEDRRG